MKLIVKKLQGGECTVEVQPSTSISELKRQVAQHLKTPPDQQKLLFLGRALVDDQTVNSYPNIKDGCKLHLIVKKPESLSDLLVKSYKRYGMSDAEAKNASQKFHRVLRETIYRLSWDEIEKLAAECLREQARKKSMTERKKL